MEWRDSNSRLEGEGEWGSEEGRVRRGSGEAREGRVSKEDVYTFATVAV